MEILWANGFYKDINLDDLQSLDGVIALAGAAICSAIQEYETGVYKRVKFSVAKSGDTYHSIRRYISDKISPNTELATRLSSLKIKMKERGEERLGL